MTKDILGDWQAMKDVRIGMGVTIFNLPKGSIISVKQYDDKVNKVLIEAGPGYIDWKHKSLLIDFDKLE